MNSNALLVSLFDAAINAVQGRSAVRQALLSTGQQNHPTQVMAVGKAACSMMLGALDVYGCIDGLVVTKYQYVDAALSSYTSSELEIIEAGHPIVDKNSLYGGQRLQARISDLGANGHLLLLVSGGASALAEVLPPHSSLTDCRALTEQMIASGQSIAQINQQRKRWSLIKDGKLLQGFKGERVDVLVISDVQGDEISVIGSGIGDAKLCSAQSLTTLVATNQIARNAIAAGAWAAGYNVVVNDASLYDDVFVLAERIATRLTIGEKGIYIFGGEPTIELPAQPGNGGRNQSLALALALQLKGHDHICVLVAATDGSDGPTNAAGGIIDGKTVGDEKAAELALKQANAGHYLRQQNACFVTGPTGTNVMDVVIAIVS